MLDFAIIGAGISGSIASAYLRKYNMSHVVLEKYSSIGGRFSAIELGGKRFNHGNLFIRDSHIHLVDLINQFLPKPLERVRLDYVNIIDSQFHVDARFIYLPESGFMADTCQDLLTGSSVELERDVAEIYHNGDHFEIIASNKTTAAKHVICTTPPTTTQALLSKLGKEIEIPPTNSIFTLLAEYSDSTFDFPYYKFIHHPILKEIFVNKQNKTITIHANDYIHESPETLNEDLIQKTIHDAFQSYFNCSVGVKALKVWKYGKDRIKKEFENNFSFGENRIFLFTDWVSSRKNSNGVEDSFQHLHRNFQQLKGTL